MAHHRENPVRSLGKPHLWLAAVDGARRPTPLDDVAPIDQPERPLEIEFFGITEEQQRKALAAFPGGRRFILKLKH